MNNLQKILTALHIDCRSDRAYKKGRRNRRLRIEPEKCEDAMQSICLPQGAVAYVPSGEPLDQALGRVTDVCVVAHADDIEFGLLHAVVECQERADRRLLGVVASDGSGCPRGPRFAACSREEMIELRWKEQQEAARIGHYAAVIGLRLPSAQLRDSRERPAVTAAIAGILRRCPRMTTAHTHGVDRHDTHRAVLRRVLDAIHLLSPGERPRRLYGAAIWGGLEAAPRRLVVQFDVTQAEPLIERLVRVYKSQNDAKNYVEAVLGRLRQNAVFRDPHAVDDAALVALALDMTELIDSPLDPVDWAANLAREFALEMADHGAAPGPRGAASGV
jgi:LmbE family N-acetylglucosaminyl deacetylase